MTRNRPWVEQETCWRPAHYRWEWVDQTSTASNSITYTSSSTTLDLSWQRFDHQQMTASTTSATWDLYRFRWEVGGVSGRGAARQPEPAEQEARRQQAEQRRAEATRERTAAYNRAEELLRSCLTEDQRNMLTRNNRFVVTAPSGRTYTITRGIAGNVYSDAGERLCIHGSSMLPEADHMLAQKLMIETDEERFRQVANISRGRLPALAA